MAKYHLVKGVQKEKLVNIVPTLLVGFINLNLITEDKINLAIFSPDRKHVVTSGHAQQLLDDIDKLKPILVVGSRFTQEAARMLKDKVSYFFCKDDSFWTDQSYLDTTIAISKRSKA